MIFGPSLGWGHGGVSFWRSPHLWKLSHGSNGLMPATICQDGVPLNIAPWGWWQLKLLNCRPLSSAIATEIVAGNIFYLSGSTAPNSCETISNSDIHWCSRMIPSTVIYCIFNFPLNILVPILGSSTLWSSRLDELLPERGDGRVVALHDGEVPLDPFASQRSGMRQKSQRWLKSPCWGLRNRDRTWGTR